MKPILVEIEYPQIATLSDRTVREVIKNLSKMVRRAQFRELEMLLRFAELDRRQSQSIKDRIRNEIQSVPVLYLHYIEKGSLVAEFALGAAFIWLLQSTFGETIKEAWKQSLVHEKIVDWVKNLRPAKMYEAIENECSSGQLLSGRAEFADVTFRETKSSFHIKINVVRIERAEITQDRQIDADFVLENAQKYLPPDKNNGGTLTRRRASGKRKKTKL